MLDIGKKLSGRYLIKGNIGMGGMANVFLADDLILDREVAVKVLRYDFQNDQSAIRRFQREALAATELVHPNIVSVYDVGEDNGMQYLVMEYVKGMDLKRYIQTHYPMDYSEVINIMQQILSAVSLAHDHQIIHRDLKPQNILIDENGVTKITDFGIAIALSETSITQTNSMLGSVHYLSPEQARGSMATKQSDIYAIGIILYEMLAGSVPFDGESAVTIALKHFQDDIPSLHVLDEGIPQALENVVLKATAKEPADRYKSAEEMSKDLDTALAPERRNEAVWHPQAMLNETKVLSPLPEEMIDPEVKEEEAKTDHEEAADDKAEKPKKKKKKRRVFAGILLALLALVALMAYFSSGGSRSQVMIPDVTGLTESGAREKLKESGLEVDDETRDFPSDEQKAGRVVKTSPEIGAQVKRNKEIVLYVSSGSPKVEMADYVDEEYEDAVDRLKELEFKESNIKKTEKYDDTVAKGKIIEQTPAADEKVVPSDTDVTFVVSKGPEPVAMIDLIGSTEDTAKQSLSSIGLSENNVAVEENYSGEDEGMVIDQSPSSGEMIIPGETQIALTVSAGEEEIEVPDVVGKEKDDANKILKDAGFKVKEEEEKSDSVDKDDVISMSPTAGNKAKKGTTVSLKVSSGKEKTKSFTINVEASYSGNGNSQKITIWLTDKNHDEEVVQEITLDSTHKNQSIPVNVTNIEGDKATITVQREGGDKVSRDVTGAETVQVPD
ncbi:MAG TPA: Stk1 family PASTA domain-containing Ser/Thr kinase [Tetragenococcus sp.]|nr:Stk1 family PASTA domain-containing Ser/Thr kinase [Tetragenococcus sp.]